MSAGSPISPFRSSRARPSAGLIPTTISAPERAEMRGAAAIVAYLAGACGTASVQQGIFPASALEDFSHVQISNGLITAQVYPPGEKQLYRGTRFDHAGVVF